MNHKWCRKAVLISMFVVLSCTTCSCQTSEKINEQDDKTPITFTFYNADGQEDPWNDPVAQEITKQTGVTLETDYPVDGDDKKIELMVATGEYPDMIFAKGDASILIENESLIDLSDLIDEYGPNIKKLYGDEYEKLRYSEDDPSIYQLCCSKIDDEALTTSGTMQMQWAVIMANDYKIPATLEEYEEMIRKYMKSNSTIDGNKTIGITICCSDWHWYTTLSNPSGYIANGAPDNGQWIVDEDYNVHYKQTEDGQKEFYQWLNEMYEDGILDPEFATQTYEDYLEKIASGRVLGLMDSGWDYIDAEQALRTDGKYDRLYLGLPVTIDDSVTCTSLEQQGIAVGWGVGITTSCEDPVRAIKFIDWLCSEEGQILLNWGIEGENYEYDEDGTRYRTQEEIEKSLENTNYEEETGVGRHNYPFPCYGTAAKDSTGNYFWPNNSETVSSSYNSVEKKALEVWGIDKLTDIFPQSDEFEEAEYAPLWSQTLSTSVKKIQDELDDITWQGLINCIVCGSDSFDEEWENLQTQLDCTGKKEAEQQVTEMLKEQVSFWNSTESK